MSPRKTSSLLSNQTATTTTSTDGNNNNDKSYNIIGSTTTTATTMNHKQQQREHDDVSCRCKLCDGKGCDVRILRCGCTLHARCCPINDHQMMRSCPMCKQSVTALHLMPMNFDEIDVARQVAVLTSFSDKRGKKRKNATVARLINTHHDMHSNPLPGQLPLTTSAGTTNTATYISPSIHPSMPEPSSSVMDTTLSATTTTSGAAAAVSAAATATTSAENEGGDLRTGRWTQEETEYCDALIQLFEQGKIPIPDGIKLNEFLANMLKSKQARLTKKMKNAKLAARQYKRSTGYIPTANEAQTFSMLENKFYTSIKCPMERSEIRFHMQKEWRELFSTYCISMGQILDASAWLSSVEELDQRTSIQKDAARMVRRKVMLGQALSIDLTNSQNRGVYINTSAASNVLQSNETSTSAPGTASALAMSSNHDNRSRNDPTTAPMHQHHITNNPCFEVSYKVDSGNDMSEASQRSQLLQELAKTERNPLIHYASPFVEKVIKIMDRLVVPFEHVDTWVPSFVDNDTPSNEDTGAGQQQPQQKCRLCFAGCGTSQNKIDAKGQLVPLSADETFDLMSFGEYSEKFSFEIGCGLPGRVYSSGVASWEQGIQNAPLQQFERSGGATQWGIQTVLGIPIPSPSAGRIVVLLYSTSDRPRDLKLVNRLTDLISKLRPSPKWKLVVDIGVGPPDKPDNLSGEEAHLHHELLLVIQKYMPADKKSPYALFLPGFTSLRLLLVQQSRSGREDELLKSILAVYATYKKGGLRSEADIAVLTARDFMVMSKPSNNMSNLNDAQIGNIGITTQQLIPNPSREVVTNGINNVQRQQQRVVQGSDTITHQNFNNNFVGNNFQDALILNTFSQMSGQAFNSGMTSVSYGESPALHSIAASPAFLGNQGNFASFSNSPTLQPIPTQQPGASLPSVGASSSPISDMLRNNGSSQFQAM